MNFKKIIILFICLLLFPLVAKADAKLVYWNVAARHNNILDDADNEDVSFISGCSPVIFEALMRGKSSKDLMLEKLNSERYANVK